MGEVVIIFAWSYELKKYMLSVLNHCLRIPSSDILRSIEIFGECLIRMHNILVQSFSNLMKPLWLFDVHATMLLCL